MRHWLSSIINQGQIVNSDHNYIWDKIWIPKILQLPLHLLEMNEDELEYCWYIVYELILITSNCQLALYGLITVGSACDTNAFLQWTLTDINNWVIYIGVHDITLILTSPSYPWSASTIKVCHILINKVIQCFYGTSSVTIIWDLCFGFTLWQQQFILVIK